MFKIASELMEKAQDFINENPGMINAMLLGGGAGGLGGALLTGKEEGDDENPGRRFKRRLKNALLGAGIGAGAGGLLTAGASNFANALPADDVDPLTEAATSPLARLFGVGSAASIGGYLQHKYKNNKAEAILNAAKGSLPDPQHTLQQVVNRFAAQRAGGAASFTGKYKPLMQDWETLLNSNNSSAIDDLGKALMRAGVDTSKLSGTGLDFQGIFKGKDLGAAGKLASMLRHARRNKYVYSAAAAGLLAPEILGTLWDGGAKLLGAGDTQS